MRLMRLLAGIGLLFVAGFGTQVFSQEEPPPAEQVEPASDAPEVPAETPAASDDAEETKEKMPFGLYVEVGGGLASADDLKIGIQTVSTSTSQSVLQLEDQQYVRAAVGWKLPHGKGDFRLRFDGFKEDGYKLSNQGYQASVDPDLGVQDQVTSNLLWWDIQVENGNVHAVRTPPQWNPLLDDANNDGRVDANEVRYGAPDLDFTSFTTSDLKNRVQVVDALYGRTFGKRRYTARWWAGMRYFNYSGNLPSTAWLMTTATGDGFTENALLPLMNFKQESTGLGPTGSMEANFNFFEDHFTLYLSGQIAFMITKIEMDSGLFNTMVEDSPLFSTAPGQVGAERDVSTWQVAVEAGMRFRLSAGVQFEAAYYRMGFLDVILVPTDMQVPAKPEEIPQGTAALYNTSDYIMDGWRFGVGFQF